MSEWVQRLPSLSFVRSFVCLVVRLVVRSCVAWLLLAWLVGWLVAGCLACFAGLSAWLYFLAALLLCGFAGCCLVDVGCAFGA